MEDFDSIPKNALPVGKPKMLIARAVVDGVLRLGRADAYNRKVYVGLEGSEKEVTDVPHQVLCVHNDAKVEWIKSMNGEIPVGAVVGSFVKQKGFIGRGLIQGELSIGRIVVEDEMMHLSYEDHALSLPDYEVLIIKHKNPMYEWIRVDNWNIPENALLAHEQQDNIFLALVRYDGKLCFGKAHAEYKTVFLPHEYDGEIGVGVKQFEVLSVDPEALG